MLETPLCRKQIVFNCALTKQFQVMKVQGSVGARAQFCVLALRYFKTSMKLDAVVAETNVPNPTKKKI